MPKIPPPLSEADKANFATLKQAAGNGDLALVSVIRKADQQPVSLVCAMGHEGGIYYPAPLAVMIEGNPFELFEDPMSCLEAIEEGHDQETNGRADTADPA